MATPGRMGWPSKCPANARLEVSRRSRARQPAASAASSTMVRPSKISVATDPAPRLIGKRAEYIRASDRLWYDRRLARSRVVSIDTIAVIGSGIMGRGIAYAAAVGGFRTILHDVSA